MINSSQQLSLPLQYLEGLRGIEICGLVNFEARLGDPWDTQRESLQVYRLHPRSKSSNFAAVSVGESGVA